MPAHSEKHRFSMMDVVLPALAAWLVFQGVIGFEPLSLLFGLGGIVYLLFTRPVRYELFQDALIIRYLAPRQKAIYLEDVEDVQVVRLPVAGPALLILRKAGSRLIIRPQDPEGFMARLKMAL